MISDGTPTSALVIKLVLETFSNSSGLKINFLKSAVIPINLSQPQAADLAVILGCPVVNFPVKYLGLPLSPRPLCRADFLSLLEKLDNRLAGWKGQLLSRAGRMVLLNAVLSTIPAFFCSAFRIPAWALKAIDKIRRGFLWKGKVLNNGFHCLVSWEQVCRPKSMGGLGIRNLKAMNSSLLMKNLWNFYNHGAQPWVKLLRKLHYKRRTPSAVGATPPRCSPIWRGILGSSVPFHTSTAVILGDGLNTSFWFSRWEGDTLLCNRLPALFASSTQKSISVRRWVQRFSTKRNFGYTTDSPGRCQDIALLTNAVSNIPLSSGPDRVTWRWDINGCFTVRSAYSFLVFDGLDTTKINHLWSIRVPPKLKIFLWLAARYRILTADLLSRKGWIGPSICCLCGGDAESLDHIFFLCQYAIEVWSWVLQAEPAVLADLLDTNGAFHTRWLRARQCLKGRRRHLLDMGIAATCWHIWIERNHRLFSS